MRWLLLALLSLSLVSPVYSQDWLDNAVVPVPTPSVDPVPAPIVNPVPVPIPDPLPDAEPCIVNDVPTVKGSIVDEVKEFTDGIREDVKELREIVEAMRKRQEDQPKPALTGFRDQYDDGCKCDCQCPTIDEIRTVVHEEIARVTVTLKSTTGAVKKVSLPLTTSTTPSVRRLPADGRWYTTHINGVPCVPVPMTTSAGSTTSYSTPDYEMRAFDWQGGSYGAVRRCRMVNGVKVCN